MKFVYLVLGVALLMAASVEAQAAAFMSGNALYLACEDGGDNDRCEAYIMGVADAFLELSAMGTINNVCVPTGPGASSLQIVLAFQNYVREHPAALVDNAAGLIGLSIEEAFPCH